MNFLFRPHNLVTHSSIKCSVSPFFLVISVFSHQPHLLHLCCCLQLHRAGCPQTVLRAAQWQYTSMACANFLWNPRTNIVIVAVGKHWSILPGRWCCVHTAWRQAECERTGFQQPELNGAALSKVLDWMALPVPLQLTLSWDSVKFSKIVFPLQSMLELSGEYPPEATKVGVVKEHECVKRCFTFVSLVTSYLLHKSISLLAGFSLRFARFFHRTDTYELI